MQEFCFNRTNLILAIMVLILIGLIIIQIIIAIYSKEKFCKTNKFVEKNKIPKNVTKIEKPVYHHQPPVTSVKPPVDMIRQYDYRKAFDPLEEPTRRVPRHEIPPVYFKRNIDIPTRGYPDNFRQFGTLVKKGNLNNNEENKIIRLFGRQEYPGSRKHEYYTSVRSGLDNIKVPINNKKQELYDGDKVYIKELDDNYEVHLSKFDEPKYYPDIIY